VIESMKRIGIGCIHGSKRRVVAWDTSPVEARIASSSLALAEDPDCSGVNRWPTNMAFVHLKNAGITDNHNLDFTKTKTIRLASEKIGKDLYCQVHHVKFTERSGNILEVITVNEVSSEECSMSGVDVFVISNHLSRR
jgi:hypothetical protein